MGLTGGGSLSPLRRPIRISPPRRARHRLFCVHCPPPPWRKTATTIASSWTGMLTGTAGESQRAVAAHARHLLALSVLFRPYGVSIHRRIRRHLCFALYLLASSIRLLSLVALFTKVMTSLVYKGCILIPKEFLIIFTVL